jgi:hypothetical protein
MPARTTKVWQVAATFRLRDLRKIVINPSDGEKRRLKPATTVIYNIKSLNFRLKAIL